jgi:DNA-binding response OmpR family regulator
MKSLLLVDDEVPTALELSKNLKHLGYCVEVTSSVESALGLIANVSFDAILVEFNLRSDLCGHLRCGNGPRLVAQLRASGFSAPLMIFTVMKGSIYESASLEAGADEFIGKPIPIPSLVASIRRHVEGHELNPETEGPLA